MRGLRGAYMQGMFVYGLFAVIGIASIVLNALDWPFIGGGGAALVIGGAAGICLSEFFKQLGKYRFEKLRGQFPRRIEEE